MKRTPEEWGKFWHNVAMTTAYSGNAELHANFAEAVRHEALTEAAELLRKDMPTHAGQRCDCTDCWDVVRVVCLQIDASIAAIENLRDEK